MGTVFRLPDLGEGLHEVEIISWHVGVGDHVVTDQPLVSVETDKALVEVPSPHSGHIAVLHGKPGDIVLVGAPLVEFSAASADAGAIVGDVAGAPLPAPAAVPARAAERPQPSRSTAAPAVRRRAAELRVDLAAVTGTGVGGTITRADVEAAAGTVESGAVRGVRRAMLKHMTRAGREVVSATVTDEADIEAWPRARM
jgi:pyruvate dehydrogenase E2 component (dihydrolipoamide acetyltransferase)